MHAMCLCSTLSKRLNSKTRCHCSNSRLPNFLLFFLFKHYNLALGFFFWFISSAFVLFAFLNSKFFGRILLLNSHHTIDACYARNVETNAGAFAFFFFCFNVLKFIINYSETHGTKNVLPSHSWVFRLASDMYGCINEWTWNILCG